MNDPFTLSPEGPTSVNLLAYGGLAFVLTVVVTRWLIGWLAARQFGKAIRVDGPDHAAKAGTPTMGGIGMLAAIAAIGGLLAWQALTLDLSRAAWHVALPLLAMFGFGLLGLVDDFQGLARKSGGRELGVGLTARRMIVAQALVAIGLVVTAHRVGIDLAPESSRLPLWVVSIAMILVIVGMVNGVNLSDGLDGLAAGLLAIAAGVLSVLPLIGLVLWRALTDIEATNREMGWSPPDPDQLLAWNLEFLVGAATVAVCIGFLVYNRHPARVFMGNVASMGLGGLLATLGLVSGFWWLLPFIGAVFVAEVLSDIIQIGYFKWTGGKRFFRMAPLHHHFEKGGMPETTIVRRFWVAGVVSAVVGIPLAVAIVSALEK